MSLRNFLSGVYLLVQGVATTETSSSTADISPSLSQRTPDHDDVDPTGHISRHNGHINVKGDTEDAYTIPSNLHILQQRNVVYERCCKPRRDAKY